MKKYLMKLLGINDYYALKDKVNSLTRQNNTLYNQNKNNLDYIKEKELREKELLDQLKELYLKTNNYELLNETLQVELNKTTEQYKHSQQLLNAVEAELDRCSNKLFEKEVELNTTIDKLNNNNFIIKSRLLELFMELNIRIKDIDMDDFYI